MHTPPFWQGLELHSSISDWQWRPVNPRNKKTVYVNNISFHVSLFFLLLQIIVSLGRLLAYPPSLFFPLAKPPAPVDGHGRQKHVVELNEQENGSSCSPLVYYKSWETFFFSTSRGCCRAVAGACFDDRACCWCCWRWPTWSSRTSW